MVLKSMSKKLPGPALSRGSASTASGQLVENQRSPRIESWGSRRNTFARPVRVRHLGSRRLRTPRRRWHHRRSATTVRCRRPEMARKLSHRDSRHQSVSAACLAIRKSIEHRARRCADRADQRGVFGRIEGAEIRQWNLQPAAIQRQEARTTGRPRFRIGRINAVLWFDRAAAPPAAADHSSHRRCGAWLRAVLVVIERQTWSNPTRCEIAIQARLPHSP